MMPVIEKLSKKCDSEKHFQAEKLKWVEEKTRQECRKDVPSTFLDSPDEKKAILLFFSLAETSSATNPNAALAN